MKSTSERLHEWEKLLKSPALDRTLSTGARVAPLYVGTEPSLAAKLKHFPEKSKVGLFWPANWDLTTANLEALASFPPEFLLLEKVETIFPKSFPQTEFKNLEGSHAIDLWKIESEGGSPAEELQFLNLSLQHNTTPAFILVSLDPEPYSGIAKLRALRLILQKYGQEKTPIYGLASFRKLTAKDPWTNWLRMTTAGFVGHTSRLDAVLLWPFDAALGAPGPLGIRQALSCGFTLREESRLGDVIDPFAGSGLIESLTAEYLETADQVRERNQIALAIESSKAAFRKKVRRREKILTGLSDFRQPDDQAIFESLGPGLSPNFKKPPFLPAEMRASFEWEKDALEISPPLKFYAACVGDREAFGPRLQFTKSIATILGHSVVTGTLDADRIERSDADYIVLCGSDSWYETELESKVPEIRRHLKSASATPWVLTGKPKGLEDRLQQAGIEYFLNRGMDVLKFSEFLKGKHL